MLLILVLTPLTSPFSLSPLGGLSDGVRVKGAEDREGEVEEEMTEDVEEADVAVDRMLVFHSSSSTSSSPPEAAPLNMLLSSH